MEKHGFLVETASEIDAGLLTRYHHIKPAIVLLDIMLEKQNGLAFLKTIMALPKENQCPFILLSSNKHPQEIIEGLSLGAIDYFVKPPDLKKLIARCQKLCEHSECILIADDDDLFSEMVRFELEKEGFKCLRVDDGNKIMETLLKNKIDLILLDRMMPGKEGLTIAREILETPQTKDIPIIIVSAKRKEHDIVDAFKLKIQDYITKPIRPKELVIRVKRCLNH